MAEKLFVIRRSNRDGMIYASEHINRHPGNLDAESFENTGDYMHGFINRGADFLGLKVAHKLDDRDICVLKFGQGVNSFTKKRFYAGLVYELRKIRGLDSEE